MLAVLNAEQPTESDGDDADDNESGDDSSSNNEDPDQDPDDDDEIFKRPPNVPRDWKRVPDRKNKGVKFVDPKNPHNYVRIQKGKPNSSNLGQRKNNIRWQINGKTRDVNGKVVGRQSQESHIPIEKFKFKQLKSYEQYYYI